jgi:hypothetical protein
MKASDIEELQRKLAKLQYERNQTEEQSDSEDVVRVEPGLPPRHIDDSHFFKNRQLTIDDFHVSTTLGTTHKSSK